MPDRNYRVVFDGELVPGRKLNDVKQALAAMYKVSPEKVETFFSGKRIIVKKDLDLESAKKHKNTIFRAGVVCRIEKVVNRPSKKLPRNTLSLVTPALKLEETVMPQSTEEMSDALITGKMDLLEKPRVAMNHEPRTLSPRLGKGDVVYSPITLHMVTNWDKGVNFNRPEAGKVSFSDILMVSVYDVKEVNTTIMKIQFFLRDKKRPFVTKGDAIRFVDFSGVRGHTAHSSMRNFVILLCNNNLSLLLDEGTKSFIHGGPPTILEKDELSLSTALAKALEAREI